VRRAKSEERRAESPEEALAMAEGGAGGTGGKKSSWPFCPVCGTILDPPKGDDVVCTFCPYKCRFSEMHIGEVVTKSAPVPKPAWVGEDKDEEEVEKHATIEEPCPKCGHHELSFYTMQLRSVDEGSTVFYECSKCNHKFSQNN